MNRLLLTMVDSPVARALAKALVLVSDQHPAWTRHDLLKQLALVMPPRPGT